MGIITQEDSNFNEMNKNNFNEGDIKQKLFQDFVVKMNNETKFKFWIRTLLSSYNVFPEIIKTVDKIIELQASTVSFMSDVYNGNNSTLGQMEKVINLTERKNSLVNVFLMTKEMLKDLPADYLDLLEKRFDLNWSIEEIAKDYNISVRTAYRKIDRLIDQIYHFCTSKNWSVRLIESQVKNEEWLYDRYTKNAYDYFKNINYKPSTKLLRI